MMGSTTKQAQIGRSKWKALRPGREWQFEDLSVPRDWSRNQVTRLLVQRAETDGWELDRIRIGNDGRRRIRLRRKIIRQQLNLVFVQE